MEEAEVTATAREDASNLRSHRGDGAGPSNRAAEGAAAEPMDETLSASNTTVGKTPRSPDEPTSAPVDDPLEPPQVTRIEEQSSVGDDAEAEGTAIVEPGSGIRTETQATPQENPPVAEPNWGNDIAAVLTVLFTLLTYQQAAERYGKWTTELESKFGKQGWLFWFADKLPLKTLNWSILAALIASVLSLAHARVPLDPSGFAYEVPLFAANWLLLFILVWILTSIDVRNRFSTRLILFFTGKLRKMKESTDWANASWHLESKESAGAMVVLQSNLTQYVEDVVVHSLVGSTENENLSLRPDHSSSVAAFDILLFGHCVEQAFENNRIKGRQIPWNRFYTHLGEVMQVAPEFFDGQSVYALEPSAVYLEVQKLSASLGAQRDDVLPASVAIEHGVRDCYIALSQHSSLRSLYCGSEGESKPSYKSTYAATANLNWSEAIRRQFAKLSAVWGLCEQPTLAEFMIPYSQRILLHMLDHGLMASFKDVYNKDDPRLELCYLQAMRTYLDASREFVLDSKRSDVASWRDAERLTAQTKDLDWGWYLIYRLDQHLYHVARTSAKVAWTFENASIRRTTDAT